MKWIIFIPRWCNVEHNMNSMPHEFCIMINNAGKRCSHINMIVRIGLTIKPIPLLERLSPFIPLSGILKCPVRLCVIRL